MFALLDVAFVGLFADQIDIAELSFRSCLVSERDFIAKVKIKGR